MIDRADDHAGSGLADADGDAETRRLGVAAEHPDPTGVPLTSPPGPMPFLQLLPNLLTMAGMCLGLTSIRFAMAGRFDIAVTLILMAACIDGVDGLLARRLQATSAFGAELDSLSDFLCFGVAPGLLLYLFALGEANSLGWIAVLIYAAAGCLRLARFNVARGEVSPASDTPKRHFTGVPAPAGAILAMLPVYLTLAGVIVSPAPFLVGAWLAIVGGLMISRLPTLSLRALRVPRGGIGIVLIGTAMAVGLIFTRFWLLMVLGCIAYLATLMPVIWRRIRRRTV